MTLSYAPSPFPAPSLIAASTPSAGPSCGKNSEFCNFVYHVTNRTWLAESSYWVLEKPLRIALIVLGALLVRALVRRTIQRIVRHTVETPKAGLLKPLSERLPVALRKAAAPSDRIVQRTQTLASLLTSICSVAIFAIAAMMVLAELGVNLGPILASAGIVGVAIGFGAQNLVRDFISGLFILLEDQYGVGDVVDLVTVSGTIEAVGLRITTVRDDKGSIWYIRNGEIVRVGNKSQGWGQVTVDIPIGFISAETVVELFTKATESLATDPEWADDLLDAPEVLGVEQVTVDGSVIRTTVKTTSEAQWRVGRELRRRLTEALDDAGLTAIIGVARSPGLTQEMLVAAGTADDADDAAAPADETIISAKPPSTSRDAAETSTATQQTTGRQGAQGATAPPALRSATPEAKGPATTSSPESSTPDNR